jgi:hypothetical protein
MMLRRWLGPGLPLTFMVASPAAAQLADGLIVQSRIPQSYDRGRNIGVEEQPRPDYAPLGVRTGGLLFYPSVEVGGGATSNTYLDAAAVGAPIVYVKPSVRLVSDWSRHRLELTGETALRDYIGESRRNERTWNIEARTRLDVRRNITVAAEAGSRRAVENLFSGEAISTLAALSRYNRSFASIQGTYTGSRTRGFLVADLTELDFNSVRLAEGGVRDQGDRDRQIKRLTGQIEYARSPSLSLFAQVSGSQTNYDRDLLGGGPNLDAKSVRVLVGSNLDIAGRIRGTIGVGYSIRDFDAGIYKTVKGFSIETRVQAFPTERLTLTGTAERAIEDAALNRTPFWNTQVGLRADYEVLRNLLVNASGDYSRLRYTNSDLRGEIYRATLGGRYLASRRVRLQATSSYSRRASNNFRLIEAVSEARIEAGISYSL